MKHIQQSRKSLRLKDYDYSQGGGYFVTICSHNRECTLGELINGEFVLSLIGEKANQFWQEIPRHFENVQLDEFIVMPNHVHAIIIIRDEPQNDKYNRRGEVSSPKCSSPKHNEKGGVTPPLQKPTLGQIVAYYKYQTTKLINQIRNTPGISVWQRNYYEHVIRSERELEKIREYILNNPLRWVLDRENLNSKNFNLDHDLYWQKVYEPQGKVNLCRGNS